MAKKIVYLDDIDQRLIAERTGVILELDGKRVSLDLANETFAKLSETLEPYLQAGMSVAIPPQTRKPVKPQANINKAQNAAIREWAAANGIDVSPRGRIPESVVERFNVAH